MHRDHQASFILSPGTQVVARGVVRVSGSDVRLPAGAVGVIVTAPMDHAHSYRVRFPDGSEAPLRRTQFTVLKDMQRPPTLGPRGVVGAPPAAPPATENGGVPGEDAIDKDAVASATLDGKAALCDPLADFNLLDGVIYRCVVGSRAYGLDEDASDTDRRGIYLPPAELHWSLYGVPEQLENEQAQECYWELQKFLTLALKANPNVLECLYTPLVEYATPLAHELRAMRGAFLSKLVYQTYNGYVLSQFKKLTARAERQAPLKWKHAMHLIRLLLAGIATLREGTVPVGVETQRARLLAIRRGEMPWMEVDAWRLELHRVFDAAYAQTRLPDRPDYARANALLIKARRMATERPMGRMAVAGATQATQIDVVALLQRWAALCARLGLQGDCGAAGHALVTRYAEPGRYYHNLQHVAECLTLLDAHQTAADDPDAVEAAIWFHDAIYVCGAPDNEAISADLAVQTLTTLGLAASRAQQIAALIRATDHRAAAQTGDAALLCDIDLAILGQPEARYAAYAAAILEETGLSAEAFAAPRHAFLRTMLDKPRLFHTATFAARYTAQARANMQREVLYWANRKASQVEPKDH